MKKRMAFAVVMVVSVFVALLATGTVCIAGSCKTENAECKINESGKECCEGLHCEIFNEVSGNGKCVANVPPPCVSTGFPACEDACGYAGGTIQDNCGNVQSCPATEDCPEVCIPEEVVCPSECGLNESVINDGCNDIVCPATDECVDPPTQPTPEPLPIPQPSNNPTVLSVTGIDFSD